MKLRIRGNSLRLRLTQGEVARLRDEGAVEERMVVTPSADGVFVYRVERSAGSAIVARLAARGVTVEIPKAMVRPWADGDEVSLSATQPAGEGDVLRLLVEKDFACLKPRASEDDGDAYPHPDPTRC